MDGGPILPGRQRSAGGPTTLLLITACHTTTTKCTTSRAYHPLPVCWRLLRGTEQRERSLPSQRSDVVCTRIRIYLTWYHHENTIPGHNLPVHGTRGEDIPSGHKKPVELVQCVRVAGECSQRCVTSVARDIPPSNL